MASGIYDCFKVDLMSGDVNLANGGDTIKVMLLDNSHAFNASHTVNTDVNGNELAASGNYTTGGATLAGQAVSMAANTATWDATDTAWASATFTAYHAVLYDTTNSNSLICSIDFGGAQTVASGTFTIQWDADGIIELA